MRRLPPAALLLALACSPDASAEKSRAACAADGRLVVVETRAHALWLCDERRVVARMRVALGRGGLDKTREGDGRTPIGTYSLGAPRASPRFGTFIPIGYPTCEQRARGFTGRDVGIHGPARGAMWLGALSTWIDWTAGCVATASDHDVAAVAAFVRERRPRVVLR